MKRGVRGRRRRSLRTWCCGSRRCRGAAARGAPVAARGAAVGARTRSPPGTTTRYAYRFGSPSDSSGCIVPILLAEIERSIAGLMA